MINLEYDKAEFAEFWEKNVLPEAKAAGKNFKDRKIVIPGYLETLEKLPPDTQIRELLINDSLYSLFIEYDLQALPADTSRHAAILEKKVNQLSALYPNEKNLPQYKAEKIKDPKTAHKLLEDLLKLQPQNENYIHASVISVYEGIKQLGRPNSELYDYMNSVRELVFNLEVRHESFNRYKGFLKYKMEQFGKSSAPLN